MNQIESADVYQILSFLLEYPTDEMQESLADVREQAKRISNENIHASLCFFIERMEKRPLDEWQELYIECFDFGRSTNLYVTYSKFGEQRQRGLELLKLKEFYQASGFEVDDCELPDYLPLMLEFCASVPIEKSNSLLTPYWNEINTIRESLHEKESDFALLLDALYFQMKENGIPEKTAETNGPVASASEDR